MKDGKQLAERFGGRLDLAVGAVLVAAGWIPILLFNHWHITAPVVFLAIGWVAVVLCGRFFWNAAMLAATEGIARDSEGFELSSGRMAELEREKKALLKAIKEVEFDREMGKMSEQDAADITRVYRSRAIDVLKELEGGGPADDATDPLEKVIDREVRARLALAGVSPRRKPPSKAPEAAPAAAAADAKAGEAEPGEAKPAEASASEASPASDGVAEASPSSDGEAAAEAPAEAAPDGDDTGDAASEKTPPTIERRRDA